MMDKKTLLNRLILITAIISLFFGHASTAQAAVCTKDQFFDLNYPDDLYVATFDELMKQKKITNKDTKLYDEILEEYKKFAGPKYSNGKRPTDAPKNTGLIYVPKEACGTKVDLLIAYHGWRTLSQLGTNDQIRDKGSGNGGKLLDQEVRKSIDKGGDPLVIAAPMYDAGPHQSVWDGYDVNTHIKKILDTLNSAGLGITFSRVSLMGHSNANCGGGLSNAAKILTGYPLYLFLSADGTCDGGNGDFITPQNILGIVKNKKAILFHMYGQDKDSEPATVIRNSTAGSINDPGSINNDKYLETWKSNDGQIFDYRLISKYHTLVPRWLLGEVLPRFFKGNYTPPTPPGKLIYDSTCPGAGQNIIVYDSKTPASGFESVYFVMHGDDLPSPMGYYDGIYKLGSRAQELPKSIFVGLRMKTFSKADFDFKCFYDEAKQKVEGELKKTFPGVTNLVAFSRGGQLLGKIFAMTSLPFSSIKYTISLDACFAGEECKKIALKPSSVRGELHMYASSDGENGEKNKLYGSGALAASTDKTFYLDTGISTHGNIPTKCLMEHIYHDDCKPKQNAPLSPNSNATDGAGVWKAIKNTPLTDDEIKAMLQNPILKIKIPGLNFSDIHLLKDDKNGSTYLDVPFLGQYMGAVYKYAVVIAGIFCVFRIIVGGFLFTVPDTSGTSKSKGKEMIKQSIMGLVITVTSYTILYTINPELVQFKNLRLIYVRGIELDYEGVTEESESTGFGQGAPTGAISPQAQATIGSLVQPTTFPACSKQAAQDISKKLANINICVGPCHCAWTASNFLSFIGCGNVLSGGANSLAVQLEQKNWVTTKIDKKNAADLPVGFVWFPGHMGVSIGDQKIFQSSQMFFKKAAEGGSCPATYDLAVASPGICTYCAKLPTENPSTGRFGADGVKGGVLGNSSCTSNQAWGETDTEKEVLDFRVVISLPGTVPANPMGCCKADIGETKVKDLMSEVLCSEFAKSSGKSELKISTAGSIKTFSEKGTITGSWDSSITDKNICNPPSPKKKK